MRTMIAIAAFSLAMNATAACPVKHPRVQPPIPDAAVATGQEMHRAQLQAEQYQLQGRTYLECGLMNRKQHNQLVSQLDSFAERFNEAQLEYQNRTRMVAGY